MAAPESQKEVIEYYAPNRMKTEFLMPKERVAGSSLASAVAAVMQQASPMHLQARRPPKVVDFTTADNSISKVTNKNLQAIEGLGNHSIRTFMVPAER